MTQPTATLANGQQLAYWTRDAVMDRLQEAARTLRNLPGAGCFPGGNRAAWPPVVQDMLEALQGSIGDDDFTDRRRSLENSRNRVRSRPTPQAISRLDETLAWLAWIPDRRHVRVLWARATGIKTGRLARELQVNRDTVRVWGRYALDRIVQALNNQENLR